MLQKLKNYFNERWPELQDRIIVAIIASAIFGIVTFLIRSIWQADWSNIWAFMGGKTTIGNGWLLCIALGFIILLGILARRLASLQRTLMQQKENATGSSFRPLEVMDQAVGSNEKEICKVDLATQQLDPLLFEPQEDNSDLFYLLLNVYDGNSATALFMNLTNRRRGIRVEGIYEVMGKRDLLIKFRYKGRMRMEELVTRYRHNLEKNKILYKNTTDQNGEDDSIRYFNVYREINPFASSTELQIRRKLLHTTADYLNTRSQRGFMFIQFLRHEKARLLSDYVNHLRTSPQVVKIIESFSICNNDLIIDFFMHCSQTSNLILLNNMTEEFLKKNELKVDKHTYICYSFNEPIVQTS